MTEKQVVIFMFLLVLSGWVVACGDGDACEPGDGEDPSYTCPSGQTCYPVEEGGEWVPRCFSNYSFEEGEHCFADKDCKKGLSCRCESYEECAYSGKEIDGILIELTAAAGWSNSYCLPPAGEGSYCVFDDECIGDLGCSTPLQNSDYFSLNKCMAISSGEFYCSGSNCPEDTACLGYACVGAWDATDVCVPEGDIGKKGVPCKAIDLDLPYYYAECDEGLECFAYPIDCPNFYSDEFLGKCWNYQCQPPGIEWAPCLDDDDCNEGLECMTQSLLFPDSSWRKEEPSTRCMTQGQQ